MRDLILRFYILSSPLTNGCNIRETLEEVLINEHLILLVTIYALSLGTEH